MIDLTFSRGLTDGMRLRKLAREFVTTIGAYSDDYPPLFHSDENIRVHFIPVMQVCDHLAFAFDTTTDSDVRYVQIAGIDCKDGTTKEAKRIAEETNRGDTPWLRYVLWTLAHELSHFQGVTDEDEADAWGLRLLEAARVRSAVLRAGTRRA